MADFPTSIYDPRTVENLPGISYDAAKTKILFAEDLNAANAEIVAIETILGENPQGAYDTVGDRLDALGTPALEDLTDVSISSVSPGEYLQWNGSDWVNASISLALDDLSDVAISGPSSGQYLQWDGSNWVNASLSLALDDLSDVAISGLASGNVLSWDGSNWVNSVPAAGVWSDGGGFAFYTGNVCIGFTGSPNATLDVHGYIRSNNGIFVDGGSLYTLGASGGNTLKFGNSYSSPTAGGTTPSPFDYYGGGSYMLTDPTIWFLVEGNGSNGYVIPAYQVY